MSKNAKLLLGVSLIGVGVYLFYKEKKKILPFTGADLLTGMPSAVGKRQ